MVALDMDDTLLMPDKSIHPDSIRDIETASERGIHVVYCSGRSVAELRPYVAQLACMRYAVCMSGAVVYDFK
ncbi:MAG: HAD hydrolase family protein [Lachnospiraceae bacterium]|nr:HAD hydrolase family protein [Lachnospiraceae bacterium]